MNITHTVEICVNLLQMHLTLAEVDLHEYCPSVSLTYLNVWTMDEKT